MRIKLEEALRGDGKEKSIRHFERWLNYSSLPDFKRNIPDNHDNFMARVMATSPFFQ